MSVDSSPEGYRDPQVVWAVEAFGAREPDSAHAVFQLGAFQTEDQARRLLAIAPERYSWAADFWINIIPVHHSLEDWMYDL